MNYCILGFNFISLYDKNKRGQYRLRVCPKTFNKLKDKIREITRKTDPTPTRDKIKKLNNLMQGWVNYFKDAAMQEKLKTLDTWVRSRIRYCIWKHWKKPNRRMRAYIQMGVKPGMAYALVLSCVEVWSRSRLGGWAVLRLQLSNHYPKPMMQTTVKLERLQRIGYRSYFDYYKQASPVLVNRLIPDGT
jgi:hypothetical protein